MRHIILFFFLCFSVQAMTQSKQFVENIGWKDKKVELHSISNRTKQSSCTFVTGADSIRAFIFTGQQLKLMHQFGLKRKGNENVLGGFMRDSSVYMFTEQAEKGVLHCATYNVVTEQLRESFIRLDLTRERPVSFVSAGSYFLYVTINNRTRELSIYRFSNEQPFGLRYQFTDALWRDLRSGFYGRGIHLQTIDQEGDQDFEALINSNKLYVSNEQVMLVMNNHIDSTYITSFDLKEAKVETWLVEHNPGKRTPRNVAYSDNSFLFRNKLYYVRATNDSLLLQVVDVVTGEINKSFSTEKREEITYKNTPFIEERSVNERRKEPRDLSKTSSLLRSMVGGSAVIMAKPHANDVVEVVVGSYEKTSSTTVAGGFPGPGYYSARPYGYGSMMPMISSARYIRSSWTNSVNFKMLLNGTNFSHVEGEPGSSPYERIERYTTKMKIDTEQTSMFATYGQYYCAYYDKAGSKLVVLKF